MKISFCIRYETKPGENVFIAGSWDEWKKFIPMAWSKGGLWACSTTLEGDELNGSVCTMEYKYVVMDGPNVTWESSDNRVVKLSNADSSFVILMDTWNYPLCTKVIVTSKLTFEKEENKLLQRRNLRRALFVTQRTSNMRNSSAL